MLTLFEIKSRVDELAQKIGAPQSLLPAYGHSNPNEGAHVEVGTLTYYYVITERGQETSRYAAFDLDELLYKIFANVTFELAIKYELAHRIETQDSRRIHFQRQVELLSALSSAWAKREEKEHQEILQRYPFDE